MPEDGQTRDAIIDNSFTQPGPEQQPATKQGRRVETSAATAAAVLGMFFSKTDNVSLGVRLEENDVVAPKPKKLDLQVDGKADASSKDGPVVKALDLIPWIPLGK